MPACARIGFLSAAMSEMTGIISCEHATNAVPSELRTMFRTSHTRTRLASHWGWDIGALGYAQHLAQVRHWPCIASAVSRLIVDTNRSLTHARLFGSEMQSLPMLLREQVLQRYYHPHRQAVADRVAEAIASHGRVLHIGAHSFTPEFAGQQRSTDIGLLYDPRRSWECAVAANWQRVLQARLPHLRIHRNRPYRGRDDGLTRTLRELWDERYYCGIEIEIRHDHLACVADQRRWGRLLAQTLAENPAVGAAVSLQRPD